MVALASDDSSLIMFRFLLYFHYNLDMPRTRVHADVTLWGHLEKNWNTF